MPLYKLISCQSGGIFPVMGYLANRGGMTDERLSGNKYRTFFPYKKRSPYGHTGIRLNKTVQSIFNELAAAHAVPAVQALITGSAADRDMSAGITGRRITLHTFRRCVYCAQAGFCFHDITHRF